MTTYPAITSLIPHRSSMALLERVVSVAEETLCAEVLISADGIFFDPLSNGVPAYLGIEYMAQAIAAFAGYWSLQRGEPVKVGLLLGSRRYESQCDAFTLGSRLHVEVHRVLQHENGLGAFDCRIVNSQDQRLLASATVTVFKPDDVQEFLKGSTAVEPQIGNKST